MATYENPRFSLGVSVLLDEMELDLSPRASQSMCEAETAPAEARTEPVCSASDNSCNESDIFDIFCEPREQTCNVDPCLVTVKRVECARTSNTLGNSNSLVLSDKSSNTSTRASTNDSSNSTTSGRWATCSTIRATTPIAADCHPYTSDQSASLDDDRYGANLRADALYPFQEVVSSHDRLSDHIYMSQEAALLSERYFQGPGHVPERCRLDVPPEFTSFVGMRLQEAAATDHQLSMVIDEEGAHPLQFGGARPQANRVDTDSSFEADEFDIQAARALRSQLRSAELVMNSNARLGTDATCHEVRLNPEQHLLCDNSSVDYDEEWDYQEARALSLQPKEVVCACDDSSVDFEEEFDFQEARAVSLQPKEVALRKTIADESLLCFAECFDDGEVELLVDGFALLRAPV